MKIKNKREFYSLYEKEHFGNRPRVWKTQEELKESQYGGEICIRGLGIPRDLVQYNIPQKNLPQILRQYAQRGIPIEKLKFNEAMPDNRLSIQGEVRLSQEHIDLTYTTIKKPMNLALEKEEIYTNGLQAINILKSNLWPPSYTDLQTLLDIYSESIIEFSSYSCNVGKIPGRNTIIWEVRNY